MSPAALEDQLFNGIGVISVASLTHGHLMPVLVSVTLENALFHGRYCADE